MIHGSNRGPASYWRRIPPRFPTPVPADNPKKTEPPEKVSDAERITGLQRAIEADQKALQKIEANLNDPASEYVQAESEFKQLDTQLEELKKSLSSIPEGRGADESAATEIQQKIDESDSQVAAGEGTI